MVRGGLMPLIWRIERLRGSKGGWGGSFQVWGRGRGLIEAIGIGRFGLRYSRCVFLNRCLPERKNQTLWALQHPNLGFNSGLVQSS